MWQQWWEPWFGLALIILWVVATGWETLRVRHELRRYRVLPEFPEKPAVVRGVRTRLLTAAALWWLPGTVVVVLLALQAPYWATAFWALLGLQLVYWLLFLYLPLRWVEEDSLKRRELYRTTAGHVDWSAWVAAEVREPQPWQWRTPRLALVVIAAGGCIWAIVAQGLPSDRHHIAYLWEHRLEADLKAEMRGMPVAEVYVDRHWPESYRPRAKQWYPGAPDADMVTIRMRPATDREQANDAINAAETVLSRWGFENEWVIEAGHEGEEQVRRFYTPPGGP